jgi:hypothetical protein
MSFPLIRAAAIAAIGFASLQGGAHASAPSVTTCTWGGTPAAATGRLTLEPGVNNTPAAHALDFFATGELSGGPGCAGTVVFDGTFDEGSTCAVILAHGRVDGLAGAEEFEVAAPGPLAPARLLDGNGNVVGSDQPQVLTQEETDSHVADCNTPAGFTHGHFSSVVEIVTGLT